MEPAVSGMKQAGKLRSVLWFVARIALAAGIIAWIVHANFASIVSSLKSIKPGWLAAALALYIAHLFACAWRWKMLLHVQKIGIRFSEAFTLMMTGIFFSLVIPGGALGGDLAKAGFLASRTPKGEKLKGVFTILIDRVIGMISLFSLAGILGLLSWKFLSGLSGVLELAVYALLLGCAGGLGSVVVLLFHRQLANFPYVPRLIALADSLTKGSLSAMMEALDDFRSEYWTLAKCILISVVLVHLNIAVAILCIGYGMGIGDASEKHFILSAVLGNAAGTIPLTPSGVGTRDVVMMTLLKATGVTEQASAITLVYTSIVLIVSFAGGIFFVFMKRYPPSSALDFR